MDERWGRHADHDQPGHDRTAPGRTAPSPAVTDPVAPVSPAGARYAWPLTGSWSLTPGTPW
jgi:hypothetical protein